MIFAAPLDTPEGPVAMPDSGWMCVEMGKESGCVTRISQDGKNFKRIARTGRPNGLALDSYGFIWVAESLLPALLRMTQAGQYEVWLKECNGKPFIFPNDLAFGPYPFMIRQGISNGIEMKRHWLIVILVVTLSGFLQAQHQEVSEPPKPYKALEEPVEDTTITFRKAFLRGKVNGHFRTFFSATDNASGLTDYNALALGGGLRYETAAFKGFRFAVGGAYLFRIASNDLLAQDPVSGTTSRYELGLFDVDQKQLGREWACLEELYLEYKRDALALTLPGRRNIFFRLRGRQGLRVGLHESARPGL